MTDIPGTFTTIGETAAVKCLVEQRYGAGNNGKPFLAFTAVRKRGK